MSIICYLTALDILRKLHKQSHYLSVLEAVVGTYIFLGFLIQCHNAMVHMPQYTSAGLQEGLEL